MTQCLVRVNYGSILKIMGDGGWISGNGGDNDNGGNKMVVVMAVIDVG